MKIGIIGSGHVGLVTGACFAHLGHEVVCIDQDKRKIALLKRGKSPIYEPGLAEMIRTNLRERRLSFGVEIAPAVRRTEVLFVCVGTPPKENGEADLTAVERFSQRHNGSGANLVFVDGHAAFFKRSYITNGNPSSREEKFNPDVIWNPRRDVP